MKDNKIILEKFGKCLTEANSAYGEQYQDASDDLEYLGGKQYSEEIEKARDGRPCVVINQTRTILDDIVNPVRQKPFGVIIDGDEDLQNHIRYIEHKSNASEAYEIALENGAGVGRGFVKVKTAYIGDSFDQEILIESKRNPLGIYLDPHSKAIDGSDANWCLELEFVSKEYAEANYQKDGENLSEDTTELYSGWVIPDESIACTNFYVKTPRKEKKILVNGQEIEELSDEERNILIERGERIKEREVETEEWTVYKIIGNKVVFETKLPILPIVPCYGNRIYDKSKLNCYKGIVHTARPLQDMINTYASQEMELASLSPKMPYMASVEAVKGYEDVWETANTKAHSFLPHNSYDEEGRPLQQPQRADNQAQTQWLINSRLKAQQDLEGLFGRNPMDAVAGGDSGKAIFLKEQATEVGTAQYIDNLKKCIKRVGEVLVEMVYFVYDTPRELGFMDEEDDVKYESADLKQAKFAKKDINVSVSAGMAYETKRKEALSLSLEAMRMNPQDSRFYADIFFKQIDSPVAKEFSERAKKLLPPELLDEESNPQALQALKVAEQTIQETQQQAEDAVNELQNAYNVIRQLQVLMGQELAKIQSDNDQNTQDNVTKILIEYMKQEGKTEEQSNKLTAEFVQQIMNLEGEVEQPTIDMPEPEGKPRMQTGMAGGSQVPDGVVLEQGMPQ